MVWCLRWPRSYTSSFILHLLPRLPLPPLSASSSLVFFLLPRLPMSHECWGPSSTSLRPTKILHHISSSRDRPPNHNLPPPPHSPRVSPVFPHLWRQRWLWALAIMDTCNFASVVAHTGFMHPSMGATKSFCNYCHKPPQPHLMGPTFTGARCYGWKVSLPPIVLPYSAFMLGEGHEHVGRDVKPCVAGWQSHPSNCG